jgi:4-hydroxy-3-methylbut-2-en-1-yl diphosphate reductase
VQVTIDPDAGFCFGVDQAIRQADKLLETGKKIYCLGDIVHNASELSRLKSKGLEVIGYNQFQQLKDATVLIRAHGEPPSTYELASRNNVKLVDATCPIVHKLQQRIGNIYSKGQDKNMQLVIFGKEGHAEIAGLSGQTDDKAIIISNDSDFDKIDFTKPISLFSQTTMDKEAFVRISKEIENRMIQACPEGNIDFQVFDTICRQVSHRAPLLDDFARNQDMVIFVSGNNSSNGKYLFSRCQKANKSSYLINNADELQKEWFAGADKIGISGATSTPLKQLEEIADKIIKITNIQP